MATVEIDEKELGRLRERSRRLGALEAAGVDNWEGYSIALSEEEDEDQ